jgi:hypothetical protein
MAKIKWRAKKAKLYVATSSSITLDSSTKYATLFGTTTEYTAYIKDITITPPEMEVELVHTLGEDANKFQNSYDEEKPATMAKLSATLVMQGDEIFENGMTGAVKVTGYKDYMYNPDQRSNKSYLVLFDDAVDEIAIVFKDAYVKFGERKITGVDGHWEQAVELITNPANYREQFKD